MSDENKKMPSTAKKTTKKQTSSVDNSVKPLTENVEETTAKTAVAKSTEKSEKATATKSAAKRKTAKPETVTTESADLKTETAKAESAELTTETANTESETAKTETATETAKTESAETETTETAKTETAETAKTETVTTETANAETETAELKAESNEDLTTQADESSNNAMAKYSSSGREGEEHLALDDTRRVKVLSPGRLVVKRFVRNKLAIVGLCILLFMFLFSFIGPLISPYTETEVFYAADEVNKTYAVGTVQTTYSTYLADGTSAPDMIGVYASQLQDSSESTRQYVSGDTTYTIVKQSIPVYSVNAFSKLKVATTNRFGTSITIEDDYKSVSGLEEQIKDNIGGSFTHLGVEYFMERNGSSYQVFTNSKSALVGYTSKYILHFNNLEDFADTAAFNYAFLANANNSTFTFDEKTYAITLEDEVYTVSLNGERVAMANFIKFADETGADAIPLSVKEDFTEHISNMTDTTSSIEDYTLNVFNGVTNSFEDKVVTVGVSRSNNSYTFNIDFTLLNIAINLPPSSEHWLGTDSNGMDHLTRMMYGGRISLMVGFIVIIIEVIIGVIMGGLSGYFGGWVDMLIMRIVDVFNCIPFLPLMIILGVVFDSMGLSPLVRIIYMMMVMGLTSWTGIARLVRGQILSLREQEFMQAAEATGISVPRRIFKHLVPNVMPQLIVSATMGLGDVIIMESTLSFLGLGAKYPMSSWGGIINGVNTSFGLKTYTYVWIPIGLLISLTVIAFNFVGDGLRDAFDPKMKR